jgi:hypothetical protein
MIGPRRAINRSLAANALDIRVTLTDDPDFASHP